MADYTALYETGNSLVELLRANLTPEPISKRELISLGSPLQNENSQMTVYLFHIEEDVQSGNRGYVPISRGTERMSPTSLTASFLITAHSKAPLLMREPDQYRMIGAAIQTIKDTPILPTGYLNGSLEQSGAELRLLLERPSFDQMLKIWNSTSTPYKLSIVVRVTGIQIDSRRTRSIRRVTEVEIGTAQRPQRLELEQEETR
ncbi:MAG: DUF4255 domain-containing protein [Faecalibacterium sp.]